MTAFASRTGTLGASSWAWEMRSVNGRGLDLRPRLPDGIDGLEAAVRAAVSARLSRGNVTVNLRLSHDETAAELQLDTHQLDRVLGALDQIQDRALGLGITLGQPTAADVLNQRGVVLQGQVAEVLDPTLPATLIADFEALLEAFCDMRAVEGAALQGILTAQIDTIAQLIDAAADAAKARRSEVSANLTTALRRIAQDVTDVDESRIAQELALLAVKSDVNEELDRLQAHVTAARDLLGKGGPLGRKLDFLSQEFNREANTLCSKAGSTVLTAIGLDLKTAIDQMREQIQNVE